MKQYCIAWAILLICSCRKQPPPAPSFRTSSLLTRITWSGPATNGLSYLFSYNNEGLVSKVTNTAWGTFQINGIQSMWKDTSYTYFEYSNGRVSKSWGSGFSSAYFRYQYDNKGLLTKRIYYSSVRVGPDSATAVLVNDVPVHFYSYLYDDKENLSEMVDSSQGQVNFRYVFDYNEHNDLISCTNFWYNGTSTPQQKEKYEWSDFDDKINFMAAVHGLPATFQWDNNYISYSSSSPNNFGVQRYYLPVKADEAFKGYCLYEWYYQYNNDGLPIKITNNPWTITLEYK